MLKKIFACTALLSTSMTAMSSSLETFVPQFQLGQNWTVKIKYYDQTALVPSLDDGTLLSYKVIGDTFVDEQSSWKISVRLKHSNELLYTLFVRKSDNQILRLGNGENPVNYAVVEKGRHSAEGVSPVIGEIIDAPIHLPVFGQDEDQKKYHYVPALLNWGFTVDITQTQVVTEESATISMKMGSKEVKQTWNSHFPWWTNAEEAGVYVAKLVSFNQSSNADQEHFYRQTHDTIETNLSQDDWHIPTSASIYAPEFTPLRSSPQIEALSGSGLADKKPWFGSWLPAYTNSGVGNKNYQSYADGGILEKYDDYASSVNRTTHAKQWELDNYSFTGSHETWYGHCNGIASAAIIFSEPKRAVEINGINFSIGDQKGLLAELAQDARVDLWLGKRYTGGSQDISDPAPYDFHRFVVENLGIKNRALVADTEKSVAVWNYPFYKYNFTSSIEGDRRMYRMNLTYAKSGSSINPYWGSWGSDDIETYYYSFALDAVGEIIPESGRWESNRHPDFLWAPSGGLRTGNYRVHNSSIHKELIFNIVNHIPAEKLTISSDLVTGDIAKNNQKVWYYADVVSDGTYSVDFKTVGLDYPVVGIYDDFEGNLLAENSDLDTTGEITSTQITLTEGNRYYFRVSSSAYYDKGAFDIKLSRVLSDNTYLNDTQTKLERGRYPTVSKIEVDNSETFNNVEVTLNIDHQQVYLLDVELVSPRGQRFTLHENGDTSDGSYQDIRKVFPLSFNNQNVKGEWQLKVTNSAFYFSGMLNEWSLSFN